MGLDIYLYQYKNYADTNEREQKADEYSTKLWNEAGEYDKITQEQKDEIREKSKEYALSLGLDEWGSDETGKTHIEEDSTIDPEHMFKVGYFRSSYNDGGIERVLGNLGIPSLYDIFEAKDEYKFQPDWGLALEKVNESIEMLKNAPEFKALKVTGNIFTKSEISSEREALEVFLKNNETQTESNYSNKDGEFFMNEPLEVLAMIPGKTKILKEHDCTYVIVKHTYEWYITALEIVKETINYVLSQENKEQYYLHWSG